MRITEPGLNVPVGGAGVEDGRGDVSRRLNPPAQPHQFLESAVYDIFSP